MNFIRLILIPLLFCSFLGNANQILKTKKNKALIKLEDVKAKRGNHFEILDHYGHLQGILRITRAHKNKAIGILISGDMKPKWTLEATTNKQVLKLEAVLKKNKNPGRSIASVKSRKKALLKKLKHFKNRKRKINRKIAQIKKVLRKKYKSHREEVTYIAENDPFLNSAPQQEPQTNSSNIEVAEVGQDSAEWNEESTASASPQLSSLRAGLLYKPSYKIQNINNNKEKITLSGLSYVEPRLFLEGVYKSKISAQLNLGYSDFRISEGNNSCDGSNCQLILGNLLGGFEFKMKLFEMKNLELKTGLQLNMIYPLKQSSNSTTNKGLYGDLGVVIGADFLFGHFVLPLYLNLNLVTPPTQIVQFYYFGLTTGLGWKF